MTRVHSAIAKLILSISLLLLKHVLLVSSDFNPATFSCLGDDATVIKFANNQSKIVPMGPETYTPQVRVMMGGYTSQWGLTYPPYIFMKEILGMNVTFEPTDDPAYIWTRVGELGSSYPDMYWDWIKDDIVDIVFEFWPLQVAAVTNGTSRYYENNQVDFGGFTGVFGEIGFYLPKYIVDEYPTIIVPSELKTNSAFREMLYYGSMNGTAGFVDGEYVTNTGTLDFVDFDGNYTKFYWERYNFYASEVDLADDANGMGEKLASTSDSSTTYQFFDNPLRDGYPVVWGTVSNYEQSRYANLLTINELENYNFVCIEHEELAGTILSDLYNKRQAFIANIYTPDINFAIIDEHTGKLQEFEKIAFDRNPDQTYYDPCYLNATCQYPVDPLYKSANPKLAERFPEAYEFFTKYTITTTSVNKMINYFIMLNDRGYSLQEQWMRAACHWLKNETSTWDNTDWKVSVNRYDCLDGCGVNGRGGSCNYLTGTCVCDHEELEFSETCDESCPGLTYVAEGYEDESRNGSISYFKFCGGHGTCQSTQLCECEEGWGDSTNPNSNGCTKAYEEYTFDVGLSATFITLSSLLCIAASICIVWLRQNAHYKTVKALSVDMTSLMTIGLVMLAGSNIPLVLPVSSGSCISWQWLFGLGGILAIMSPLLKAYRVSRVFHGGKMLRAVKITDKMLMSMLIKAALFEVLVLVGYSACHEIFGGTIKYYNDDELRVETQCNERDSQITQYLFLGSIAYFFIMLCALTYYSYGTRRALAVFQESTCAYMSSFLSLFCALITFVFSIATEDPNFRASVQAAAIIVVVSAVLILFYGVRIYKFYTEPENRNVTDMRVGATTGTQSYSSKNLGNKEQQQFSKPGPA
jgi:hypothetical protein